MCADGCRADLATLVDMVATGRVHPEIGEIADWSETRACWPRCAIARCEAKLSSLCPGQPEASLSTGTVAG
jgi:hypothetical protein